MLSFCRVVLLKGEVFHFKKDELIFINTCFAQLLSCGGVAFVDFVEVVSWKPALVHSIYLLAYIVLKNS